MLVCLFSLSFLFSLCNMPQNCLGRVCLKQKSRRVQSTNSPAINAAFEFVNLDRGPSFLEYNNCIFYSHIAFFCLLSSMNTFQVPAG